jgi:hypothetical protein
MHMALTACSLPSDSELVERFQRNKADFETLVRMSNEDHTLVRIADDFTRLENDWSWPRPESKWGITRQVGPIPRLVLEASFRGRSR